MIRTTPAALAALAILTFAAPAGAQDGGPSDLSRRFRTFEAGVRGEGVTLTLEKDVLITLDEGANHTEVLQLAAGATYGVQGMCDNDCADLDLLLTDSNGETVDSDFETDAGPSLTVQESAGGRHTLSIQMAACSIKPCLVGVRVYQLR